MKMKKKALISMLAVTATLALGAFMGGCSLSDNIKQWKCDHENITENVVIDPTCYEKGELKETCDDCGKTWTEDIAKVAHTWNDGEVVVEATCTETGITRYTCTVEGCEAVEDRITDKLEHTRVEMPAVAPTCDTVGYTEWYKCDDCGLVLTKKQELPALGHVETELKAVAPTCTETGLTAGVGCATCGEVITAQTVVPATGHNIVTVAGKAPTCTIAGSTDGQACKTCGIVYVEQTGLPATGHRFVGESCAICNVSISAYENFDLLSTYEYTDSTPIAGKWLKITKENYSKNRCVIDNNLDIVINYGDYYGPAISVSGLPPVDLDSHFYAFVETDDYYYVRFDTMSKFSDDNEYHFDITENSILTSYPSLVGIVIFN